MESGRDRALSFILIPVFLTVLVGSVVLARRNLRLGRGDRRGATRVASLYFAVRMLVWLFTEHHNGLPGREFNLFLSYLSYSIFFASFMWLLYVALEPFIRKRWPMWIISWSRLLAGDYRDPLIGRDVLVGAVVGLGMALTVIVAYLTPRWLGRPTMLSLNPGSFDLGRLFFNRFATQLSAAFFIAFIAVFLLLLFVAVLRRRWAALIVLWLLLALINSLMVSASLIMIPFTAFAALALVFALKRYGLLAMSSALFFYHLWIFYPMTTEVTAWYATDFLIALVICVALVGFGFYTSLGGQKLLSGKLLEE